MKRIYFNHLASKKNTFLIIILIFLLLLEILDVFDVLKFENPYIMKGIRVFFLFLLIVDNFQKVFFKNYFEWNKKGAIIKINQWWGKTLVFDEITSIKMDKDILQIKFYTGKIEKFNLKQIKPESKIRLKEILSQHTRNFIEE